MGRNAVFLLVARLTSAGTTLVMLALVAQLRGGEALGAVGIGFAAGAIGAAISDLGVSSLLVREAARRPEAAARYLGTGLLIRAAAVPVLLIIIAAAAAAIAPGNITVVVLVAAGLIFQNAAELTRSIFLARQRMMLASAHATIENLVWLAVVTIGLAGGNTLEATFSGALLIWIGSVAAGLVMARVLAGVAPTLPRRTELPEITGRAGPFAAFSVIGIAYSRLDPLLIGLLATGPALVTAGAYFAAARFVAAFEYLPEAVSRAAFPELSRRVASDPAGVEPVLRAAARLLLAVGLAVPVVVLPSSGLIMATLFEVDPNDAGWILGALACAVPLRYLGYLHGVTLTSSDAQGRRVVAASSALLLVVVIDVAGIPRVGVLAPVTAAIAAASVISLLYGRSVQRRFGVTGVRIPEAARLLVAAIGATVLGAFLAGQIPPIGASLAALGIYGLLLAGGLAIARRSNRSARRRASASRVLLAHPSDEAYGADRMLRLVATGLRDRGHAVLVLLPRDTQPGWLSARLADDGIPVEYVELAVARRRYFHPPGLLRELGRLRLARAEVRAAAVRHRAEIVHLNTSALLVGVILGRPGGARLVWHVHEIVVRPRLMAWLFRIAPPLAADRVIAISDAVRQHLRPLGRLRGRVVTVHNGLPDRPLAAEGDRFRQPLVACVGRLNRWKGQSVFVDAIALLDGRFPDARFLIAGDAPPGEPERRQQLLARIHAAGLDARIELVGFVEDGAAIFDDAAVAVVPSIWPEPFGLVVLEAMQAGCTVIATDHGGAAELIEHGRSGLLVPPSDPAALAEAIARVLADPSLGAALGAAGRARSERSFGASAMLDGIEAVYEALE